jgi:N-acetylneuraminic acid mutarotase
MNTRSFRCIAYATVVCLNACGGGGDESGAPIVTNPAPVITYTATSGVAQKGPLILGSTVTAQELTAALAPNGRQYSYQTNSDLGTFVPNSAFTSRYIGVSVNGYYFDEVANAISSGPITLNAYADLDAHSVLNINLLTSLAYQRIANLVSSGATFAAAETRAQQEVLAALGIHDVENPASFVTLDLSKSTQGDRILAAVSGLFVYGNTPGNLSALMANFQADIATDGVIDSPATRDTLRASAQMLNASAVAANLNQKYSSLGVTISATDISGWIDSDGDGLIGKFEFHVPDASQNSAFTIPAAVSGSHVGAAVSIVNGNLSINGTAVNAATPIATGDVLRVSPPAGSFPNGVQTAYLMVGARKIARVSFVSGLASIGVTPGDESLPQGLTRQFTAIGTYTDGSISDLTGSVSWASTMPGIANIAANSGLATGTALGTTTVTATSGSIVGSTSLTIAAPALLSIVVTPNPASVALGRTSRVVATGTYSDGSSADISATATWEVSNPATSTVTGGTIAGLSLGNATVTATLGSISANAAFQVATNAWQPAASMATARASHSATLLNDGRVLVTGGGGSSQIFSSAEIYDPPSDSWSPAATMAVERAYHTATLLADGRVLVAGGTFRVPDGNSAEIYDPATNTWSSAGTMAVARAHHIAARLSNGTVLVVGFGISGPGSAEIYNPAANTWSPAADLAISRDDHAAALLPNGSVLITGGNRVGAGTAEMSSETFDPVAGTWTAAPMMVARWKHTATALGNGKILVAAGSAPPLLVFNSAELFDPVAITWTPAANLSMARSDHTATLLPTGEVLVVGGRFDITPSFTSSELYDPDSNTWSSAAPTNRRHARHTATLLANGKVLVVGGSEGLGLPGAGASTAAELFDYAGNPN